MEGEGEPQPPSSCGVTASAGHGEAAALRAGSEMLYLWKRLGWSRRPWSQAAGCDYGASPLPLINLLILPTRKGF